MVVFLIMFAWFVFYMPNYLGHPDNYIVADPLKTPAHIVPEWYFLPFYAILRAVTFNIGPIDSKLGGVLAMFGAIVVLFLVPWLDTSKVRSAVYRPWYKLFFWLFAANAIFLGWLGSKPAEGWYIPAMQARHAVLLRFLPRHHAGARADRDAAPRIPNSITEAVLEKNKNGAGHPAERERERKPRADGRKRFRAFPMALAQRSGRVRRRAWRHG
jgi:ubiquinol-cytochrome c reductase cytochrome b subunit